MKMLKNSGRINSPAPKLLCAAWLTFGILAAGAYGDESEKKYRGRIGEDSWKIQKENGKTKIWAGGDKTGPGAKWYDFTDSPIPAEKLQFGIGKDRIPSIDDPIFVAPDDPRLLRISGKSHYYPEFAAETNDEIKVIGWVEGNDARAYPAVLLERHELVNDKFGGKPITVGW